MWLFDETCWVVILCGGVLFKSGGANLFVVDCRHCFTFQFCTYIYIYIYKCVYIGSLQENAGLQVTPRLYLDKIFCASRSFACVF
jgi:hypothetical protein